MRDGKLSLHLWCQHPTLAPVLFRAAPLVTQLLADGLRKALTPLMCVCVCALYLCRTEIKMESAWLIAKCNTSPFCNSCFACLAMKLYETLQVSPHVTFNKYGSHFPGIHLCQLWLCHGRCQGLILVI